VQGATSLEGLKALLVEIGGVRPAAAAPAARLPAFRHGATFDALVVARLSGNLYELLMDGARVSARTTLALEPGARLTLEVEHPGPPARLRALGALPAGEDPVARALRVALPRQTPLANLLAALEPLAAPGANTTRAGSADGIAALLRPLLAALPSESAITDPGGLRRAVLDSGVFLEARLRAALGRGPTDVPATLAGDLKGHLLRLLAAVGRAPPPGRATASGASLPATPIAADGTASAAQPPARPSPDLSAARAPALSGTPPAPSASGPSVAGPPLAGPSIESLAREVEGALYRVQLNQLVSLEPTASSSTVWHIELPLRERDGGVLALRIERDAPGAAGGENSEASWVVNLTVPLADLGTLFARIALVGTRLSATLWAERPATAALAERGLRSLRERLDAAGLTVTALHCRAGRPSSWPAGAPVRAILSARA